MIFLEPRFIYRAFRQKVPDGPETLPPGQAEVARSGGDLTLVTWGAPKELLLEA